MRTLWAVGVFTLVGLAGAFGSFGRDGPYLAALASLVIGWTIWRHRWPTELPFGLRSIEAPEGPDERAVMVEFRHENNLLGWDVGILWFEKGGIGFVGRTVSFIVPRAAMQATPSPPALRSLLRAPQMKAQVYETTVGIVPLGEELKSQMTLARIEALPEATPAETVLPPTTMHPDLIQRGLTASRRIPLIVGVTVANYAMTMLAREYSHTPRGLPHLVSIVVGGMVLLYGLMFGSTIPNSIRKRYLRP